MNSIDIDKLLAIGISLSKERNRSRLLQTILVEAMDISLCDGGTLYIKKDDKLFFEVMITRSQDVSKGGVNDPITLPPVPYSENNVCAYVAMHGKLFNLPDVYNSELFDFSGPRKYDAMTGYRTTSMLVVPMENDYGDIIGVLQLINALDSDGNVVPFAKEYEKIVQSLSSQAAICLTNMLYAQEIQSMFDSFVQTFMTAVEARSPYNASHTRNMVRYSEQFLDWLEYTNNPLAFSHDQRHAFIMSVWLHDIGKLVIPLEIMDKDDRLGNLERSVKHRFEIIGLNIRLAYAEGTISKDTSVGLMKQLDTAKHLVATINTASFLTDEQIATVDTLSKLTWTDYDGCTHSWLTPNEAESLSTKRGTLTQSERDIIESHVVMTEKILNQMQFPARYAFVPKWASAHHERINGSGYPSHISDEQIPMEVRLLTIIDIYDAITASDRPYKPPIPPEKALDILVKMGVSNELDQNLLDLFISSRVWNNLNTTSDSEGSSTL